MELNLNAVLEAALKEVFEKYVLQRMTQLINEQVEAKVEQVIGDLPYEFPLAIHDLSCSTDKEVAALSKRLNDHINRIEDLENMIDTKIEQAIDDIDWQSQMQDNLDISYFEDEICLMRGSEDYESFDSRVRAVVRDMDFSTRAD